MQKQFEDIIAENFPIREAVERLTKIEKNIKDFDTDDFVGTSRPTKIVKKNSDSGEGCPGHLSTDLFHLSIPRDNMSRHAPP